MTDANRRRPKKTFGWFLRQQGAAWAAFHRELVHGVVHRALIRTKGDTFSRLYNARSWAKRKDVRTYHDTSQRRTTVRSGSVEVEVYPQLRATIYERGIVERSETLGADYLLPLIDFAPGDVVVDCGANVGDLKLYFRNRGIAIEYIGIEPGPGEFAAMQRNVHPSTAYNVGLWDSDGEMTFYVSSDGADSSLIEPPAYDTKVKVAIRRLDTLVDVPAIKLLKVEAEGAEPEVLRGAADLFDRIEYISADLGAERGLEQTSTLAPVTNYLLANGFELVEVNHRRVSALFRNVSSK